VILIAVVVAAGVLAGYVIARWWAILLSVPFGFWMRHQFRDVEVSPDELGIAAAAFFGAGVLLGFVLRWSRSASARHRP
jgi:hypothetical protein